VERARVETVVVAIGLVVTAAAPTRAGEAAEAHATDAACVAAAAAYAR